MNNIIEVIKEQFNSFGIIRRVAKYEDKATYQSHYLGLIWQFLNPLIQIAIYYLIFGLGLNQGKTINGIPYIVWMLIGIIPWFFISKSILGGSNSVYKKIKLVSKMKFPISILPSINMMGNIVSYGWMMLILLLVMLVFGLLPTIYWLQYIYYFVCMIAFLFALGILNSTITVLVRDFHIMLQSIMRLLFYISGAIWNIENQNIPEWLIKLIQLNPIYYITSGFRDSFMSQEFFWEKPTLTLIFWGALLLILLMGTHIHMKFRSRFVDFI